MLLYMCLVDEEILTWGVHGAALLQLVDTEQAGEKECDRWS